MFFGLCNSPSTFQAMMNDTLKHEIKEGFCIIYMDNILIFAKNKEDLKRFTKSILKSLWKADLYLKPSKCEFCKMKIKYLGLIIKEGKIMMDPMKLNGIHNWPIPKNIKRVCSFLGFGNFYQCFIQKFSELAQPFNKLLQKDQPFIWDNAAQKAFDEMKKCFTEEPILMMPDQTWPFQIKCDASKYASGAVLTQLDVNGDWHLCAFISQTFSPTEWNYEIYDHKLLSMIEPSKNGNTIFKDLMKQWFIQITRTSLTYFQSAQKLNRWQAWWSLLLSEYDIKLVHLPGSKMILSDTLSWQPDFVPEKDTNNEDIILLPDQLFINLIDIELQWEIANTDNLDTNATAAIMLLLGKGPTDLKQDLSDWTTEDSEGKPILFYQGKNYILKDYDLWKNWPSPNNSQQQNGSGCNLVCSGPQTYEGGDPYPLFKNTHRRRHQRNFTSSHLQMIWTSWQDYLWSRPTIYHQIIPGTP